MSHSPTAAVDEKRLRTLTEKGQDLYEEQCNIHRDKLEKTWQNLEDLLVVTIEEDHDISKLNLLQRDISTCKLKYFHESELFINFLSRQNTEDSNRRLIEHKLLHKKAETVIDKKLQEIKSLKLDRIDEASVKSSSNKTSSVCSDTASVLLKKRLKAESERTKLEFMEKEAKLMREKAILAEQQSYANAASERKKAELDVDMNLLKQQTDIAVTEAEVKALEDIELQDRGLSPESFDRKHFTQDYIEQWALDVEKVEQDKVKGLNSYPESDIPHPSRNINFQPTPRQLPNYNPDRDHDFDSVLNPNAEIFQPNQIAHHPGVASDFAQFLLKKDLLLTRFTNFNDRPESFSSWKASFKSIIKDLNVSSFEEMDLLVKWLGPESRNYASSIRAANMSNPNKGLNRIWERLQDRYGRPEMVESALKSKINSFPKLTVKDNKQLYQLSDLLSEIESCKENSNYSTLLSYFDSSAGVRPIVSKLPYHLQERWTTQASKYKVRHNVSFPSFTFFVNFIRELANVRNDPSFLIESPVVTSPERKDRRVPIRPMSRKTDITSDMSDHDILKRCPIHKAQHSLNSCRAFKSKSFADWKKFLREKQICFRCCNSISHVARNCKDKIKCTDCGSTSHSSGMHIEAKSPVPVNMNGGEHTPVSKSNEETPLKESVSSKCTTLCGNSFIGRSCGKVVPVEVYPTAHPEKATRVYAILDDQSNRTLASKTLIDNLGASGEQTQYTLSSCSGTVSVLGRRVSNISVRAVDGSNAVNLPVLIECNEIPNDVSEVPTPDVAKNYKHLRSLISEIPALDPDLDIQLLIGRDVPELHYVYDQITGPVGTPFAQRLSLGWVIIGQVCLGGWHQPDKVYSNKTNIRQDGRSTVFEPCDNSFVLKEISVKRDFTGDNLFQKTSNDDYIGFSIEDRKFLELMDKEFYKDDEGHWTAPLPFKTPKTEMPNNRSLAWKRAQLLDSNLKKDPIKREHFVTFMQKVLQSGAAEVAPSCTDKDCWYLPLFGVYHPKKPEQIRGVFDSSAEYQGMSLNSVLMSGPDLNNSLLGVLLRFRMNKVAITADIEQMFYKFYVTEAHRDYLRFFWYKNNDPDDRLIEYRMRVHVFGNSPSPAVATYGLRRAVAVCEKEFGSDVKDFVENNFYVDDGLVSVHDPGTAINLMKRTQAALKSEGGIRLHKITSNSLEVMNAFPVEDLIKDLKDLHIGEDSLPIQHSLGLSWDLNTDTFVFNVQLSDKPFTKRGLLSTVNGLFDPLGFIAPITPTGKILLREIAKPGVDWDEPLSPHQQLEWDRWRTSLLALRDVKIPRMYVPESLSVCKVSELYIFSDASEKAVAASAYLKILDSHGNPHFGFVMGKSKLAPLKGHTIPRLELCGAVLATELGRIVTDQLHLDPKTFKYFTDSKVVLGYINNQTRRFYTYVSNRVDAILRISSSDQWNYVPSDKNSADCCTREGMSVIGICDSPWLSGPKLPCNNNDIHSENSYPLINPHADKEIRPDAITTRKTVAETPQSMESRFQTFSRWRNLVVAISRLMHFVRSFNNPEGKCVGWHKCTVFKNVQSYRSAEILILKTVQSAHYASEISRLLDAKPLAQNSSILALSPFLDENGLLRVGGRLNKLKGQLAAGEMNPVILPKNHHASLLLIRHYHEAVRHQGRHLTEGALRSGGYWIIGSRRMISSIIHNCVICRKLRRNLEHQKMANLPSDRLTPGPPFSSVGVDTFGPWQVVTRKTRGGCADSKRWAILFTCLTTRAVHIELVEQMSSSSFINALRRFMSLRGPVETFRSDRGTNFIGAIDELKIDAVNVEEGRVSKYLYDSGTKWFFNVPHSSHMGGVWERMIGIARRIPDSVLLESRFKALTHETLSTFMLEVCAIMNSRPIADISSDPESPMILSPSMLLTGKVRSLPVISESLDIKDIYRAQWKHAQMLANMFWKRWKKDYFQCLQSRRKWQQEKCNLKVGDVVLLKDSSVHRNDWPLGIIDEVFESDDKIVRKVTVRISKEGKCVTYVRPINELVLLIE